MSTRNIGPCSCCGGDGGDGCNVDESWCDFSGGDAPTPNLAHLSIDGLLDGEPHYFVAPNAHIFSTTGFGFCPDGAPHGRAVSSLPEVTYTPENCGAGEPFSGELVGCGGEDTYDMALSNTYVESTYQCLASGLNGGYETNDITSIAFGLQYQADFHLGTLGSVSDPGVLVGESTVKAEGCSVALGGVSGSITFHCKSYVYTLRAIYQCFPCPQGTGSKMRLVSVSSIGDQRVSYYSYSGAERDAEDYPTTPTVYEGGCFVCGDQCADKIDANCFSATQLLSTQWRDWPYDEDCFPSTGPGQYCDGGNAGLGFTGCYDGVDFSCSDCTEISRTLTNRYDICDTCASCGKAGPVTYQGRLS